LARILLDEEDVSERERLFKLATKRTRISLKALRASAKTAASKMQAKQRDEQKSKAASSPAESEASREKTDQRQRAAIEAILDQVQSTITLSAQTSANDRLVYVPRLVKRARYSSPVQVLPYH